jgi:hypothetical protein
MRSEILSIVAVIGLLPCAGRAQETGTVACPSIENDQERLACYDRAMRAAPHAPPSSAPTPPASVQAPPSAAAPAAVAAPVAVGAAAAAAPPPPPTPAPPAPAPVAPTTPAPAAAPPPNGSAVAAAAATTAVAAQAASGTSASAAPAAAATPPSTVSTAPHNSRNKHPSSADAPPTIDPSSGLPTGVLPITVVSTLVRPGFPIEFTTDKGVWVQGETKPVPALPKAPFKAQLEPGKLGGAFLVVPEKKLGIRVYDADR